MDTASLRARLQSLQESLKLIQQLITRLSKLSSDNEDDEENTRTDLADEIHQNLKEQEDDFELIQQDAEDLTNSYNWSRRRDSDKSVAREKEKAELASLVTRVGEDLRTAGGQFRKAQLQAKRNIEIAKHKEREQYLLEIQNDDAQTDEQAPITGDPSTTSIGQQQRQRRAHQRGPQTEKLSQDDLVLGASNDVTAALQRTHTLMTAELERSQFTRETLENSTKELSQLTDSYSNLDTLLSSSRSLVSTLIHSRKSDTWYLETTFYILLGTIAWLVFRRILYGPGWWLLYLPLRSTWWLISTVLLSPVLAIFGAVGGGKIGNSTTSVSVLGGRISSSTSVIVTAGRGSIPTSPVDMPAPSIRVGGGGQGAKADPHHPAGSNLQSNSMIEEIGEMAEKGKESQRDQESQPHQEQEQEEGQVQEQGHDQDQQSQEGATVLRQRKPEDGPRNPKKRMWEEPVGDAAHANRPRDEL